MTASAWIWTDAHGSDRNDFSLFRRVLELPAWPDSAELHLFADARYRLRVNGAIVGYGPGRFVPAHPAFDTIDLKPWLKPGTNVVLVEAWAPNANSFQAMPESRGGFIAWGAVSCHGAQTDLATLGADVLGQGEARRVLEHLVRGAAAQVGRYAHYVLLGSRIMYPYEGSVPGSSINPCF